VQPEAKIIDIMWHLEASLKAQSKTGSRSAKKADKK